MLLRYLKERRIRRVRKAYGEALASGGLDSAAKLIEEKRRVLAGSAHGRLLLAQHHFARREPVEALANLRDALRRRDLDRETALVAVQYLMGLGQFRLAEQTLRKPLSASRPGRLATLAAWQLARRTRRGDRMPALLENMRRCASGSFEYLYHAAANLLRMGRDQRAVALLDRAAARLPEAVERDARSSLQRLRRTAEFPLVQSSRDRVYVVGGVVHLGDEEVRGGEGYRPIVALTLEDVVWILRRFLNMGFAFGWCFDTVVPAVRNDLPIAVFLGHHAKVPVKGINQVTPEEHVLLVEAIANDEDFSRNVRGFLESSAASTTHFAVIHKASDDRMPDVVGYVTRESAWVPWNTSGPQVPVTGEDLGAVYANYEQMASGGLPEIIRAMEDAYHRIPVDDGLGAVLDYYASEHTMIREELRPIGPVRKPETETWMSIELPPGRIREQLDERSADSLREALDSTWGLEEIPEDLFDDLCGIIRSSKEHRDEVFGILASRDEKKAREALIAMGREAHDPDLHAFLAGILCRSNDRRTLALTRRWISHPDLSVRMAVLRGTDSPYTGLMKLAADPRFIETFETLLRNTSQVRIEALRILGQFPVPSGDRIDISYLLTDPDDRVRTLGLLAAGRQGIALSADTICEALKDPHPAVVGAALECVVQEHSPFPADAVVRLASHRDPSVAVAGLRALLVRGSRQARDSGFANLRTRSPSLIQDLFRRLPERAEPGRIAEMLDVLLLRKDHAQVLGPVLENVIPRADSQVLARLRAVADLLVLVASPKLPQIIYRHGSWVDGDTLRNLTGGSPEVAYEAAGALVAWGETEYREVLAWGEASRDLEERFHASLARLRYDPLADVEAVCEALTSGADTRAFHRVILTLAREDQPVEQIRTHLDDHPEEEYLLTEFVREWIEESLGHLPTAVVPDHLDTVSRTIHGLRRFLCPPVHDRFLEDLGGDPERPYSRLAVLHYLRDHDLNRAVRLALASIEEDRSDLYLLSNEILRRAM